MQKPTKYFSRSLYGKKCIRFIVSGLKGYLAPENRMCGHKASHLQEQNKRRKIDNIFGNLVKKTSKAGSAFFQALNYCGIRARLVPSFAYLPHPQSQGAQRMKLAKEERDRRRLASTGLCWTVVFHRPIPNHRSCSELQSRLPSKAFWRVTSTKKTYFNINNFCFGFGFLQQSIYNFDVLMISPPTELFGGLQPFAQ